MAFSIWLVPFMRQKEQVKSAAKLQKIFEICKKNHRFLVWKAIFMGKFLRIVEKNRDKHLPAQDPSPTETQSPRSRGHHNGDHIRKNNAHEGRCSCISIDLVIGPVYGRRVRGAWSS